MIINPQQAQQPQPDRKSADVEQVGSGAVARSGETVRPVTVLAKLAANLEILKPTELDGLCSNFARLITLESARRGLPLPGKVNVRNPNPQVGPELPLSDKAQVIYSDIQAVAAQTEGDNDTWLKFDSMASSAIWNAVRVSRRSGPR